ncbi:MAG: c-type cytochrome [Candidatus Eiseniibacteriota bacterium]
MIEGASDSFVRLAEAALVVLLALEVAILVCFLSWRDGERGRGTAGARPRWLVAGPLVAALGFGVSAFAVSRTGALAPGLPGAGMPWERVTDETPAAEAAKAGERAYLNRCAPCHLPDGRGLPPSYPSLVESPIVRGPVADHVQVALFGSAGLKEHRPGVARMPAFGAAASDAELAAILTYQRKQWGSGADPVRPSDVARGRTQGSPQRGQAKGGSQGGPEAPR